MAHLISPDAGGCRRVGTHVFALLAVLAIALVGMSTAAPAADLAPPQVAPPLNTDPEPSSVLTAPLPLDLGLTAQLPLDLGQLTPAPTPLAALRTQGADQQAAAVSFNPRLGLPQWLRTIHDAQLWSGADPGATSSGSLPAATTYVKPLGPFAGTRVQVYFPGDADHASALAWVDTTTVEPSGVPAWVAPGAQQPSAGPAAVETLLPAAPQRVGVAPAPPTSAVHVAIVDGDSGQLIYGEAPNTEVPQASTTKIATTIVALERSPDLSKRIDVTVSASAMAARDGSSTMGIEPGRSVSLDTLLHGMMLPSGNDAAEQVAVALANSREQYVDWMNQEAAALGLTDTHFMNPSGMDAAGHYSSAYDMAMLARYAMHNPSFRDLASTSRFTGDGFPMSNLNRFLEMYPGADGVKIGYTDAALKTIVASANHDGHRVYVSLMRSQDLVGDSTALFNWVWGNFQW